MALFDVIAFDGDDTLWENEYLFTEAQEKFKHILMQYLPAEGIDARLYETETRNIQHFGYGIKSFILSMIESGIELTEGRIKSHEIQSLLDIARQMLGAEVQLRDYVAETLPTLAAAHSLMIITKGDIYDQEAKIARSGIAPHFEHVHVVSTKLPETYQSLLSKHRIEPSRFMMVGNSLKSDILPVLAIGGQAVYIPHPHTWAHEHADPPSRDQHGYFELEHIGQLPELLARLAELSSPSSPLSTK